MRKTTPSPEEYDVTKYEVRERIRIEYWLTIGIISLSRYNDLCEQLQVIVDNWI